MASIRLAEVTKVYEGAVRAVEGLSLQLADGELLVLVGPSGCGKTTVLRMLAGLEQPSTGRVFFGETDVTDLAPHHRNVCLIPQRPALLPGKTAKHNLVFGERLRHPWRAWGRRYRALGEVGRRQVEYEETKEAEQLETIARTLGIEQLLDQRELSGGEQQRVSLARAWLRSPILFLLDEPLSQVDAPLRWRLRRELHLLQRRLKTTMLYVTHDPAEAFDLADRVAVMRRGALLQIGSPREIVDQPVDRFVAEFAGKGPMNCLDGRIDQGPGLLGFAAPGFGLPLPPQYVERFAKFANQEITLGIRPEDVAISERASDNSMVELTVEQVQSVGPVPLTVCSKGSGTLLAMSQVQARQGQKVMASIRWERVFVFDRSSGRTLSGPAG